MGKLYSLISALLLAVGVAYAVSPDSYEWWFDHDVSSAQAGSLTGREIDLQIDTSELPKGIHYFNLRLAEGDSIYGAVYRKLFHAIGKDSGAVSYEYWYDNDFGAKVTGDISEGSSSLELNTSDLPKGIHYFNCRVGYGDGSWGPAYRRMFHAIGPDSGAISYEYWYDNDFDSKVSGDISKGSNVLDLDVSHLPKGIHYFNCRLGYCDGSWGPAYRHMFHAIGPDNGAVSYEYWFDSDYDSKISGSLDVGSNHLDLDISSLPQGAHHFNCRLGYADGSWGAVYRRMFLSLDADVNAVAYEYWIDNNYSAKTEGSVAPGANSYDVDLTGVRRGLHRFNYRLMTAEGVWGAPFISYFYSQSNGARFTAYEYWLDNDYANRVSESATGNPTSFEVDLSSFDKSGGAHYFNLRTRDDDGDWSPVYHKLLVFTETDKKQPIIGYRQFINGNELDYVEVERQFVDSYMFDVNLPDSIYPSVSNRRLSFDGDRVYIAGGDSIDYVMQIRTELGWAAPQKWRLGVGNDFSTSAVAMEINSRHTFTVPKELEFAAMKFTANGDSLYFRSDIPVALDIYHGGDRVAAISAAQVKGMVMLRLEAGEYFGVLHSVEDPEAQSFTLNLMDTPNQVPMPTITFEDEVVTITCSRSDAEIRYTLDGNDPDTDSELYADPFPMTRNGVVKAKAWVPGSDIEPSAVAEYRIDTYKVAAPVAEFDVAQRLLTLKSETKDASILYTHEYDETDSIGGVWTDYKDPIQIRKNCIVYSRAVFDGYHDSDITVTEIKSLPDSVPMPSIEFETGIVTISCDEKDAEIHYTLDGTRPTAASTLYEGAFPLRRNANVMAFAYVPGLDIDSSRVATRVVDSYKVATPKGSFDVKTRLLTLTCDTVGASIYYSFDRDGEWTAYSATEPIRLRKNCTVYAKAVFDGYNDSDIAEIVVSELPDEVARPVITCDGAVVDGTATVAISCATEDAEIRYSFDDEKPTTGSNLYEKEFTISRNVRVNAFAYIPDLDIEPSAVSSILCDVFHVDDIRYDFNSETRELTIECDTEGAMILYTFDPNGEWTEYTAPIQIKKNCTLYAKAVRDGYHDSLTETITINSLADSVPVPLISFQDGMVTIECPNTDARIRYALDDAPLNMESTLYEGAFPLRRNATVKAFAYIPGLDIEPSDPVTFVVDSYKVELPTGNFNAERRELTLTCATEDAKILYSFDPEGAWTEYTGPIAITRNCTVYAKATLDGWNESDVAPIVVNVLADSVATPAIDFNDGTVTITCASEGAEIHYTIDDENLTAESPLYGGPFALDRNATIRAFALIPGLDIEPSGVTTKVINSFTVAKPSGKFNAEERTLTISCATDGAKILYSFDTAGGWTEYTGAISITKNCTVYAKATRDGYNDSEIAEIEVNELADSVAAPVIDFNDGTVTISCASERAEIHYTIDDENLTAASPLYEGPFTINRNVTIRAFALIPGLDIAPSEVTTEVINSFKVKTPYGLFAAAERLLSIYCDTDEASIFHSMDREGPWTPYSTPLTIEGNGTVYAKATRDGWNDSDIGEIVVSDVKCAPVNIEYDGHYAHLSTAEEGAEIRYTTDGSEPSGGERYTAPVDVEGLGTLRAVAVKSGHMNSDIAEKRILSYTDETHAELAEGGLLASSFGWNTAVPDSVSSYRIEGRLDDADYAFVASMKALRHLDIEKVEEARIPDGAFSGTKLISISLPTDLAEYGDGILSGTPVLSSVIWNSKESGPESKLTDSLDNPNVLLYVSEGVDVSRSSEMNVVFGKHAASIELHYGFPYFAARDFKADSVSLTHEFIQTTIPDTCRGWETIVLPFEPSRITHAKNGPIVPFEAWNGNTAGDEKPFWLYSAKDGDWQAANRIEARVPYIISMPNHKDYVETFRLGGKVIFSATDVALGPETSDPYSDQWREGTRFEGTFLPTEEPGLLSLNVNASESSGLHPGSHFIPDGVTPPFGAYVRGTDGRRAMPLFGGSSGVDLPLLIDSGLVIESPAPGTLKISSGRERRVAVTTVAGVTLRTLHLRPGETATVEGLTRDLYIVAGRKVFVK